MGKPQQEDDAKRKETTHTKKRNRKSNDSLGNGFMFVCFTLLLLLLEQLAIVGSFPSWLAGDRIASSFSSTRQLSSAFCSTLYPEPLPIASMRNQDTHISKREGGGYAFMCVHVRV